MTLGEAFEAALAAARNGEEWAWAALYRDLAGNVTGYLASRGATEPDDLTSETFLQVARGLDSFSGDETAFRSWVFVIAHRRMQDARRAAKRRPASSDGDDVLETRAAPTDVEAEALGAIGDARLAAALDTLSETQRDVLYLRVIGDLSVVDTARVIGKSPGAVKVLQHRALRALKEVLDETA